MLFLHGDGERGKDNEEQLMHGDRLFLKQEKRKDFPAIVIFPQCRPNSFWSNVDFKMENGKLSVAGVKRNIIDLSSDIFEEFDKATKKARGEGKKIIVGITHADDISQATKLKEMILSLKNTEVAFINLTCFPIGGHIGPNSLILSWQE